jgi:hypothetical protein
MGDLIESVSPSPNRQSAHADWRLLLNPEPQQTLK